MGDSEHSGEGLEPSGSEEGTRESTIARLAAALRRTDVQPKLLLAAKAARELLPGDSGSSKTSTAAAHSFANC